MEITDIANEWNWARGLTLDLLKACSNEELSFGLNASCGPLWKQFRHIGRVHENYLQAIETRKVCFGTDRCTYTSGCCRDALLSYFQQLDSNHNTIFSACDPSLQVDWFGEQKSLGLHFVSLLTHETLHHGQLILYWRALGNKFPDSWSDWGE